jgi:hypothetical protein
VVLPGVLHPFSIVHFLPEHVLNLLGCTNVSRIRWTRLGIHTGTVLHHGCEDTAITITIVFSASALYIKGPNWKV